MKTPIESGFDNPTTMNQPKPPQHTPQPLKRFRLCATVTGSKYIGEVEAETLDEATQKGYELDECHVSVCHHCSKQIEDPEITEIHADEIKP